MTDKEHQYIDEELRNMKPNTCHPASATYQEDGVWKCARCEKALEPFTNL